MWSEEELHEFMQEHQKQYKAIKNSKAFERAFDDYTDAYGGDLYRQFSNMSAKKRHRRMEHVFMRRYMPDWQEEYAKLQQRKNNKQEPKQENKQEPKQQSKQQEPKQEPKQASEQKAQAQTANTPKQNKQSKEPKQSKPKESLQPAAQKETTPAPQQTSPVKPPKDKNAKEQSQSKNSSSDMLDLSGGEDNEEDTHQPPEPLPDNGKEQEQKIQASQVSRVTQVTQASMPAQKSSPAKKLKQEAKDTKQSSKISNRDKAAEQSSKSEPAKPSKPKKIHNLSGRIGVISERHAKEHRNRRPRHFAENEHANWAVRNIRYDTYQAAKKFIMTHRDIFGDTLIDDFSKRSTKDGDIITAIIYAFISQFDDGAQAMAESHPSGQTRKRGKELRLAVPHASEKHKLSLIDRKLQELETDIMAEAYLAAYQNYVNIFGEDLDKDSSLPKRNSHDLPIDSSAIQEMVNDARHRIKEMLRIQRQREGSNMK